MTDTPADWNSLREQAVLRWYLYEYFHRALGTNPTRALLLELSSETALRALTARRTETEAAGRFVRALERLRRMLVEDRVRTEGDVRCEHAHFFADPRKLDAVPWQFARDEQGLLFSHAALELRATYRSQGLTPVLGSCVSDDHVALELAFMAALSKRTIEAVELDDHEAFAKSADAQKAFLDRYLGRLMPSYASEAAASGTGILYPQAIAALAEFVAFDQACLQAIEGPDRLTRA